MNASPKILIVDDEEGMRFFLSEAMKKEGYPFETASDGREALEKLRSGAFKIVLMDIKMPRLNGLLAMEKMKELDPDLLVILMTAFGTKKVALETLQKGAYDYFTKPFDLDEMRIVIKRAAERCRLQEEVQSLHRRLGDFMEAGADEEHAHLPAAGRIRRLDTAHGIDRLALATGNRGRVELVIDRMNRGVSLNVSVDLVSDAELQEAPNWPPGAGIGHGVPHAATPPPKSLGTAFLLAVMITFGIPSRK